MCLVKVLIDGPGEARPPIRDVVDVQVDGAVVRITTLFGEAFVFEELVIAHVDLSTNTIRLVGGDEHERP